MNIFTVLTQGNSRLHEPSISAMLGYLLDSNGDHGFGNRFLTTFVQTLALETNSKELHQLAEDEDLNSSIQLEKICFYKGQKSLDVQVDLYTSDLTLVKYSLVIENKIKSSSVKANQLTQYYNVVKKSEDSKITNPVVMIYLTPTGSEKTLKDEFDSLPLTDCDHKAWLSWLPKPQNEFDNKHYSSVIELLKDLLSKEIKGEIPPMNEYLRHTLKGFIFHLEYTMRTKKKLRVSAKDDASAIVAEKEVEMNDGSIYQIIRRKSQQITVWNNQQKVPAKPMLRVINTEKKLGIEHKELTTQQFGRLAIQRLNELEQAS